MAWVCPDCERTLKSKNQHHYCYQNTIDNLFEGKDPELILVFDTILAEVIEWGDNILVSATKNCIVFVSSQTFLVIRPMKTQLNVKFYREEISKDPLIFKVLKYGRYYAHNIRVKKLEDVDVHLLSYLNTSYKLFIKKEDD